MNFNDVGNTQRQPSTTDATSSHDGLQPRMHGVPGKRTHSMGLPGLGAASASTLAVVGDGSIQKKSGDTDHVQRPQPDARSRFTEHWTNVAMRPDLHAAPVQTDGGENGQSENAVHALAAQGISGTGTTLPHLGAIQRSFGRHDVTGVQTHIGGAAAKASEGMGAEAYATGQHVAFRKEPDLHTAAHEAAHVVQQRAGVQLKDGVGLAGDSYERHADAVADSVVAGRSAEALLNGTAAASTGSSVQQLAGKSGGSWVVQVGLYHSQKDAVQCMQHIKSPSKLSLSYNRGKKLYVLFMGPYDTRESAVVDYEAYGGQSFVRQFSAANEAIIDPNENKKSAEEHKTHGQGGKTLKPKSQGAGGNGLPVLPSRPSTNMEEEIASHEQDFLFPGPQYIFKGKGVAKVFLIKDNKGKTTLTRKGVAKVKLGALGMKIDPANLALEVSITGGNTFKYGPKIEFKNGHPIVKFAISYEDDIPGENGYSFRVKVEGSVSLELLPLIEPPAPIPIPIPIPVPGGRPIPVPPVPPPIPVITPAEVLKRIPTVIFKRLKLIPVILIPPLVDPNWGNGNDNTMS